MFRCALLIAAVSLAAIFAFAAAPEPDRNCTVCGKALKVGIDQTWMLDAGSERLQESIKSGLFLPSQVYTNTDTALTNLHVGTYICLCEDCHKIVNRCSLCNLPIKDKSVRTSDGRWICPRDLPLVVMDEDAARELFESARETAVDVVGNFFALKNPNVNVHVADVFERSVSRDGMHTMAISKTTDSGTELVHYVSVYTGRPKDEAFYSCVHEYTHLWINENIDEHEIEPNTREGFCELIAYKVAESRGDAAAQKRILSNTYTKGRIKDLVQYASEEDLSAILNWIPHGTTRRLAEGLATATAAKLKPSEIPLDIRISEAQAQARRAQQNLQNETVAINGIIHTPRGTLVLLTGGLILGKGDSGSLKLNGQFTHIKCIDIQADSAVLQLEDSTNALTLKLSHK